MMGTALCRSWNPAFLPFASQFHSLELLHHSRPLFLRNYSHRRIPIPAATHPPTEPYCDVVRCNLGGQAPCCVTLGIGQTLQYEGVRVYTAKDIALRFLYVFGWDVKVDGEIIGKVDEIIHIGRIGGDTDAESPYEYILKVVNSTSTKDALESVGEEQLGSVYRQTSGIKILIPIVDEFIQNIDVKKRCLLVKPPDGLLELATRPQAIQRLQPELQLFCKQFSHFLQARFCDAGNKKIKCNENSDVKQMVQSYMPTREQLLEAGRNDLVRKIRAAGGFLYVAHALGLKTTRRPNGFWDDLGKLDFEIECFLLESWVKKVHQETGSIYFENLVTRQVAVQKPEAKSNYKYSSITRDGSRVMPQQKLVCRAQRWDLHHAIMWNGGYREVAHNLGRTLVRMTKKRQQQEREMLSLLLTKQMTIRNQ